jgi:hypothetical protein
MATMLKPAERALLPLIFAACASHAPQAWSAHPLNTDDTGVQGAGNFQLELTYDASRDRELGVDERVDNFSTTLSYGLTDTIDIVLAVPYLRTETRDPALTSTQRERGFGDSALQLKWKFHERAPLSFALKPGMTFTTGDDSRGLGAGKNTYGLLLVSSLEYESRAYHFNLGYTHNNNLDNAAIRTNLFLVSAAVTFDLTDKLTLVGDVGKMTNADRASRSHPGYALLGLIYSPRENVDLDAGIQVGLNDVSEDRIYRIGLTLRWGSERKAL